MKKRTIFSVMFMLCLVAQEASAFRLRLKVPTGSDSDESSPYTWIIYAVIAIAVLVGLYTYLKQFKTVFRHLGSSFKMDAKTTLSSDQQRKVLLGAAYYVQDKVYMNSLKTGMTSEEREERLDDAWNISNNRNAMNVLGELKVECKKSYFPQIAEAFKLKNQQDIDKYLNDTFVNQSDLLACSKQIERAFKSIGNLVKLGIVRNEDDFVRIGDAGWATSRLVYVARMCLESKFINEAEFWQFVDVADEVAHQSLTSWEDFGKSYIIGLCLWGASGYEVKHQVREVNKLLEDPKSPWKTFPFGK
ncbi:DUF1266 domain-containing protein [Prevotella nigrescens]|uniref:DUF1266 domain-containing protein n=1 Tax=Prevotella nigrescens TaxID=28133 RepID=UPI0028D340E1|nr:DUF1266 domain-containing protein [Prevotella nigrescens]